MKGLPIARIPGGAPTGQSSGFSGIKPPGSPSPGRRSTGRASFRVTAMQKRETDVTYLVHFRVQKKLEDGRQMCVMGCTENLGEWKRPTYFLKWTPGDVWVSQRPVVMKCNYFQYKYAMVENRTEIVGWERGVDRIADLKLMPESGFSSPETSQLASQHTVTKVIEMNDTWETFTMSLSVWNYDQDMYDQMIMDSVTDSRYQGMQMQKVPMDMVWLNVKYGKKMCPWKTSVTVENIHGTNCGQFDRSSGAQEFTYGYIKRSFNKTVHERDPKRVLELQDPSKYDGRLGDQGHAIQVNTDKIFIVNGHADKADGNFIGLFNFKKIHELNLHMGSYPLWDGDVHKLNDAGVNAVLDIQTTIDYRMRGIQTRHLTELYRRNGIKQFLNSPVCDYEEEQYAEGLFKSACVLNTLVNEKGYSVYVHDTNGVSRVPTLIMVYMALFIKHKQWNNIPALQQYLRMHYPEGHPNIDMVKKVINDNKDFQNQQLKKLQDDEDRRRRQAEESGRQKQLQDANDEAERIRLLRLAEAEAEKDRLERVNYEEAEKRRQQQLEDERAEIDWKKKLEAERARIEALKLQEQEADRLRRQKWADEEGRRLDEIERLKRLIEQEAEKIRQDQIELDRLKEAARLKREREEQEEEERLRKLRIQKEEEERLRLEQLEIEEQERIRLMEIQEHDENERLKWIKEAELESERIRIERLAIEEAEKRRKESAAHEAEAERQRLLKFSFDEAQRLLERLESIEKTDQKGSVYVERTRRFANGNSKLHYSDTYEETTVNDTPNPQSAFIGLGTLGLSEVDLEQQCEQLFQETPIPFKERKNNEVDEMIQFYIKNHNLTIPIVWVKENTYLTGSHKYQVDIKRDQLMIKVDENWEKFEDHVPDNHKYYQKMLVVYMIKSGESLEHVVDCLVNGSRIKNIFAVKQALISDAKRSLSRGSFSRSPLASTALRSSTPDRIGSRPSFTYSKSITPKVTRDHVHQTLKSSYSPYSGVDTKSAMSYKRRSMINKIQSTTQKYTDVSPMHGSTTLFDAEYNGNGDYAVVDYNQRKSQIVASLKEINDKLIHAGSKNALQMEQSSDSN